MLKEIAISIRLVFSYDCARCSLQCKLSSPNTSKRSGFCISNYHEVLIYSYVLTCTLYGLFRTAFSSIVKLNVCLGKVNGVGLVLGEKLLSQCSFRRMHEKRILTNIGHILNI